MSKARSPLLKLALVAAIAVSCLLLPADEGRAVQAPRISLDMIIDGTAYDENTNTMISGPIDNCLGSEPPGDNAGHGHIVHLVIQEVEDLVGWQARLNYDGGRMRPATANFIPFLDNLRGQGVSFTNLPIDPGTGVHREIVSGAAIPPGAAGPQTALLGATHGGPPTAPLSPDTPAKAAPDDTSYSAPTGGVLASINLQVLPGMANQPLLVMDLDDGSPNPPGSRVVVFTDSGNTDIDLAESSLFDGFHAEGSACVPPPGIMTPPPTSGPGAPGGSPGTNGGANGGTSVPGATSPGGASPGAASPGQTGTTGGDPNDADGTDDDGDGGTPFWLYVLIVIVVALVAAGAFAAWRYRSRLPWLRDRFH